MQTRDNGASFPNVYALDIRTNGGDDAVTNLTNLPSIIDGGSGNDILRGGNGTDTIYGGDDNDRLSGGNGRD